MKAVLIIPEQEETLCQSVPCILLFPLTDRPFLQHVVEALVGRGITDVQIVLGRGAEVIERFLGDGSRWGCSFSYHLLGDPQRSARVLRGLTADDGYVLIASADQLPMLPSSLATSGPGMLIGTPGDWTGWAVVDVRELMAVRADSLAELIQHLTLRGLPWLGAGRRVVLRSLSDVPAAQERFLGGEVPGALVAARELQPGVWLARNVRVAPTSTFNPPVFVGENTVVGAGVRLGPFAAIGPNCMLDRDSAVRDTTTCAGTYVGPGVELDGVIVDGSSLIQPHQRTVATVDGRLLDHLVPVFPLSLAPGRVLAALAFLLAIPIVIAAALWLWLTRPGPVFWRRQFVRAPASASEAVWPSGSVYVLTPPQYNDDEYGWVIPATFRGLVLELLPALGCIANGSLQLVGIAPRGKELLQAQGARCPSLLRAAPGLMTEVALCDREHLAPEDCLLVDVYQTQTSRFLANLKRIGRFLYRALTVWGKSWPGTILPRADVTGPLPRSASIPTGSIARASPGSIAPPPAGRDLGASDRSSDCDDDRVLERSYQNEAYPEGSRLSRSGDDL